jgi:signal transduction histidine kinase
MSHELRTPLNAIIGFTGTLLMGLPGPLNEEQAHQLRLVETSGQHLLSLINGLLDLAKTESGTVEITGSTFGVGPCDCPLTRPRSSPAVPRRSDAAAG